MTSKRLLCAITGILASASAFSVVEAAEENTWKAEVELGLVMTSGNTETNTLNTKAKVETEREKWRHSASLEVLTSSNDSVTTAERFLLAGKSDYKIDKQNYIFALVSYEQDSFSGYDHQLSEAVGYGRRVIAEPNLTLDLEIGPGARQSKLETGGSENEVMVRGAGNLAWKVSDTSKFSEHLSTEIGEDVTITKSVTSLTAKVNSSLATKLSYTIKHASEVPAGLEKTDTETAVTLVYVF